MDNSVVSGHSHFVLALSEIGEIDASICGLHPWDAESYDLQDSSLKSEMTKLFAEVDAVGEIGLDYVAEVDREAQKELFVEQLKLAKKLGKPVVIHCVKAFEPTMLILKKFPLVGVVFHSFIGSVQQMNQAIECGYYISFSSRVFASPKSLKALREAPLDRIFFEVSAGEDLVELYERAAKYRMESGEELKKAAKENFAKAFPKNRHGIK